MRTLYKNGSNTIIRPVFPVSDDSQIFRIMREEVLGIVNALAPKRRSVILLKALLFPLAYVLVYLSALKWGQQPAALFGCFFLLGLLIVVIFLNLVHDAVHGTIFKQKWANKIFIRFFDLMGANSFLWQVRHVRFHHNYPNVNGWDTDIEQSKLARVFPDSVYAQFHRYQHIYLPLLYPFYVPNWLLFRDFSDFFDKNKTVRKLVSIPRIEYFRLFFFKVIFLFYMVILPGLVSKIPWWQSIAAFAVMLFTASIFSLLVLLSPHANTESAFPLPGGNHMLPHSWMMHMLLTTNDITQDNFFTRFFMGCFNYHVAHHLFPNINHTYYPEITSCLRKYANEFGWPYRSYSLMSSLKNHYMLLRKNGMPESIFEETM